MWLNDPSVIQIKVFYFGTILRLRYSFESFLISSWFCLSIDTPFKRMRFSEVLIHV